VAAEWKYDCGGCRERLRSSRLSTQSVCVRRSKTGAKAPLAPPRVPLPLTLHTYCTCSYMQCLPSLLIYADRLYNCIYNVWSSSLCRVCKAFCMLRWYLNFNFQHCREDVNPLLLTLMAVQWFSLMIILRAFMKSTHQVPV